MTNHVHLIAVPAGPQSLALTMRDTHQAYAAWLNRKTGQSGHLWQGRFFSCVLDPDDSHYWSAVRYVERNPVRAGLVQRAEQYPWSSAAVHCGRRPDKRLGEAASLISGDLVIFNLYTIHGSYINTTREPRRLVRVGYRDPLNFQVAGQSFGRPGMMVAGYRTRQPGQELYKQD